MTKACIVVLWVKDGWGERKIASIFGPFAGWRAAEEWIAARPDRAFYSWYELEAP